MTDFIGRGHAHSRTGVTRRGFLQAGTLGAVSLSLPAALAATRPAVSQAKHGDRACIMIFNVGGPSQIDTFDPKPDAPADVRGPFRTIRTRSPEIQLTELLPRHAKIADRFSLVRSCYHTGPAVHDAGWQLMQTGGSPGDGGGALTPHIGSAVSRLRGARNGVPPFVVLPEPMRHGGGRLPDAQAGGPLGPAHGAFIPAADPAAPGSHDAVAALSSPQAREAFDLSREKPAVRDRYGRNRFGQSCLLARRLVEAGVRFVTLNTFVTVFDTVSWDIHGSRPFTTMQQMKDIVCPMYDQAYTALIEDLEQRGLLDSTLVCNLAEFGRTPRINAAGGRDHWPQCFTVGFAGAGVQGGRVIGRSDRTGSAPADRPTPPEAIAATIYHAMGLDPQPALVAPGAQPIHELF